jgi:eukaryotic-like serine/threonine-protein kinase
MSFTVECNACRKRMFVPDELYEKRVRGRVALLACRGCPVKIRLDGTGPEPAVTGGTVVPEDAPPPPPSEPSKPERNSVPIQPASPLTRIGRYALFDQFAAGGMATVHLGRLDGAGGFSRVVAIKRLLPHLVQNEDFTQMLLKEARLAARVRHPNVVPTLDVVASKGDVLLVLEYVHGESLSTLCRRQAKEKRAHVPVDVAIGVMHDLLQGLDAVHDATDEKGRPLGMVHRDISPPNVIVGADGLARVLDFGIAKALEHIEESNPDRVKGKSGYMSPEQIRGERLTQRSDVFSAGIILWELLATRRLFSAEQEHERMQLILDGNYKSPTFHRPDLPSVLDDVVMRALDPDPEKRFASPREFASALEQAAPGATQRRVADWVNELAGDSLAVRARMVAQVDTWTEGEELPLNSAPFAAEAAVILTAPPPGVAGDQLPAEPRRRASDRAAATPAPPALVAPIAPSSSPPPRSSAPVAPGEDASQQSALKWRWFASLAFIVAAGVVGYLAFR